MDHQIAMLWMRGALSFLEQLCVQSFLDAGHHVVLYSYEPIEGVPEGVETRDAALILPEAGDLIHERTGSPAPHADRFRYLMLARGEGMIWADTDAYCLKPFQSRDGHLYGWESDRHVNIGVLGLPPDSPTLAALVEFTGDAEAIPPWEKPWKRREMEAARKAGQPIRSIAENWGVWGPQAFTHFLSETGEIARALPQAALYPYTFAERRKLLAPGRDHSGVITDETLSIHLYGRRIRKRMAEHDQGLPNPDSLMGQLLIKHRIDPCEAPLRDWPDPDRDAPFARAYREAAEGRSYPAVTPTRPLDKVVAITTMKNEGPFILDWVAYHLSIGITHFLVYTNDCDDPTCEILDALAARGLVTRVDNPVAEGERPQRVALKLAQTHPRVEEADAYVVMDVDEYINIHTGDGTLADLFAAAGDPDLLSMTWRFFGAGGVTAFKDTPVVEQFNRAAPLKVRKPHQNWGFKTIVRREAPFSEIGVHRPLEPTTKTMPRWTNGSGAQMPDKYLEQGWRSNIDCWGYDLVTLNHYAVRSVESFLVKRDRGRTNHITRDQGLEYWAVYNRNDRPEHSIIERWKRAEPLRQTLARDPSIGALHDQAVTWHQQRIAKLRARPDFAALYDHFAARVDPPPPRPALNLPPLVDPAPTGRVNAAGHPILIGAGAEAAYRRLQLANRDLGHLEPSDQPLARERLTVIAEYHADAPFLVEWLAFHKSIGITDVVLLARAPGPDDIAFLDCLKTLGHLDYVALPAATEQENPRWRALRDIADHPLVACADWRIVIDLDEFINIHVGDGTLDALLTQMGEPNVVSMTWRIFGNGGVRAYEDRFITEQFTRAAPRFIPKPRTGWGFRSMVHRSAPFARLGPHRPIGLNEPRIGDLRWVNGSGRVMPEDLARGRDGRSSKRTLGYDMVTLNRYALRSAESYLTRVAAQSDEPDLSAFGEAFRACDYGTETDTTIHAHLPRARAIWEEMMSDQKVKAHHEKSVTRHRRRINALLKRSRYRALFDAIADAPREDAVFLDSRPTPEVEIA